MVRVRRTLYIKSYTPPPPVISLLGALRWKNVALLRCIGRSNSPSTVPLEDTDISKGACCLKRNLGSRFPG